MFHRSPNKDIEHYTGMDLDVLNAWSITSSNSRQDGYTVNHAGEVVSSFFDGTDAQCLIVGLPE